MGEHRSENQIIRPWLLALGREELPRELIIRGNIYRHVKTFKHDFFAATSLYQGATGKIVLKVGRMAPLFGLPMAWIGRLLSQHEIRMFELTQSIAGVPELLGSWGTIGLVHAYVEGRPLQKSDTPDDEFFPKLALMLEAIHARGAAYVDLEKRENILLGEDGQPHLIDFQISWHLPANRGGEIWPFRVVRDVLQASDRYHLYKHWRRLRPDQLAASANGDSFEVPIWIRWHRMMFRPLTLLRRQILVWLGVRDSIRVRSPG